MMLVVNSGSDSGSGSGSVNNELLRILGWFVSVIFGNFLEELMEVLLGFGGFVCLYIYLSTISLWNDEFTICQECVK